MVALVRAPRRVDQRAGRTREELRQVPLHAGCDTRDGLDARRIVGGQTLAQQVENGDDGDFTAERRNEVSPGEGRNERVERQRSTAAARLISGGTASFGSFRIGKAAREGGIAFADEGRPDFIGSGGVLDQTS